MRQELIALIVLAAAILILLPEFMWLYRLAERQEEHVKKYDDAQKKVNAMVEAALYSPTDSSRVREVRALKQFAGDDTLILEMICDKLIALMNTDPNILGDKVESVRFLYNQINPIRVYSSIFKNGDAYKKGYACRKLADFHATEYVEDMRPLVDNKNRTLSYNVAMALSQLGDEESVAKYILHCQKDYQFSHRIILELFDIYTGDRASLVKRILDRCDAYMYATIVKAIAPYKFEEFEELFIDGMNSRNSGIRVACTKALGAFAKPEHEHALIIATHDNDWVVRSTAVKGLELLESSEAIEAVQSATKDKEWWVRQTAARALVNMDKSMRHIESVLKGYDKYATDAVKYSLYRSIDLKEDENK